MKVQKAKLFLVLFALAMLLIPAGAQDATNETATIVYGRGTDSNAYSDDFTMSNYYCNALHCLYVNGSMYIDLIEADAEIGWYAPNLRGALARDWTYSADNRQITLQLRDDLVWSDGTPITARDVMMSYDLTANEASRASGKSVVAFESVEIIDDYTIQMTMTQRSCNAINTIAETFEVVPAHVYQQLIDEVGYAELRNHSWFDAPDVVSGEWQFASIDDTGNVIMSRNPQYDDIGQEMDESIQYFQVQGITNSNETITPEWFLNSEITWLESVPNHQHQAFLDAAMRDELQVYQYPDDFFVLMALNNADPTNPQPAFDDDGTRIEQGYHPIFSDTKARQAIAYAIDIETLIDETVDGLASPLVSQTLSTSWAYNLDLSPIQRDRDYALNLLAEAGWLPENPDLPASSDNKLICVDCLYAREVDANYNGSYLAFEILVAGLVAEAELIQSQLAEIGITTTLTSENFFGAMLGQTYDAVILGFNGSYPYNPVSTTLFGVTEDVPETGVGDGRLNITSFYNEAYFALEETALTIPNCGITERAEIYRQMQVIMREQMPVVWLYTRDAMFVAKNNLIGFDPRPDNWWWNSNTWRLEPNR